MSEAADTTSRGGDKATSSTHAAAETPRLNANANENNAGDETMQDATEKGSDVQDDTKADAMPRGYCCIRVRH